MSLSTGGKEFIQAGSENLTDGTAKSAAIWREVLQNLRTLGYIEPLGTTAGNYRLTGAGYRAADQAKKELDDKKQLEIDLKIDGSAPSQSLEVKSNKEVQLRQIEYLTTAGVCAAHQEVDNVGESAKVPIDHDKVVKLFNVPRSDRQHSDHAGPAVIRLTYS